MKIVNTVGTIREPFDVASGLAEILIQLNVAKQYVPDLFAPPAVLKHSNTEWFVVPADNILGDKNLPPHISGQCLACGIKTHYEGSAPSSGCEVRHKLECDGGTEVCPRSIANEYLELRKLFYKDRPAPKADPLKELLKTLRTTGA